jgi:transposase
VKFIGIDLHKKTISVCVVDQSRKILARKRFPCAEEPALQAWFQSQGEFSAVVEATSSYEWFVRLIEPFATKVVLAHPKKLRVIAESTRKSDKLDAQVLAEFLALDIIPASYRPTPRQRDHRRLVRQRDSIQRRITSVKNRIRWILADHNADRPDLFRTGVLSIELTKVPLSPAERSILRQHQEDLSFHRQQLIKANQELQEFVKASPPMEQQWRELLRTIPGVGFVTAEVVLAEIADIRRFSSADQVSAYAGLSPGERESGGKSHELHIEKNGSKHLRWILVEAAWRLVRHSPRWQATYLRLKARLRAKKAIVAVARRLLGVITAVLKRGEPYSATYVAA